MRRTEASLLAVLAIFFAGGCTMSESPNGAGASSAEPKSAAKPAEKATALTILATGDVGADTEQCGCKIRQMGGIARRAQVVKEREAARPGGVLVVDAGDLFFKTPLLSPRDLAQARETAAFFADSLGHMHTPAMAVGERDLALGLGELRSLAKRSGTKLLAANLVHAATGTAAFDAFTIVERSGVKIGLVGLALEMDPAVPAYVVYKDSGLALRPIEPALVEAAKAARAAGADFVLGLFHTGMTRARELMAKVEPGLVDLAIVSHDRAASSDAEAVGKSAVVMPGERGKWLLALDVDVVPGGRGLFNQGAVDQARRSITEIDQRIGAYEREDAGVADPAMAERLATDRRATIERLKKRRTQVESELAQVSAEGRHRAKAELVVLDVALPEEPELLAKLNVYKARLGLVNAATGLDNVQSDLKYVGSKACRECHQAAYAHWQTTKHAKAWATMEKTRQTGNLDCIGCHVTGFDRPGGPAGLAGLERYVNVGCESCHGPGSAHAEQPEVKTSVDLKASGVICSECHRAQADQKPFVLHERLPKVLGPGHGEPAPGAPKGKPAKPAKKKS